MPRTKKEDPFYTMLKDFATQIEDDAQLYKKLVDGYPDTKYLIPEIKLRESQCDQTVQNIMKELYASFITPIDRNDLMDLTLKMDDVPDHIKGVTMRFDLFNVSGMHTEAKEMAHLTVIAVKQMHRMIDALPNYKNDPTCMELATSIDSIEDEGDSVYESGLRNLFREEDSPHRRPGHVVAWLRLFDRMELCLDAVDEVAGIVRSVIMKSA